MHMFTKAFLFVLLGFGLANSVTAATINGDFESGLAGFAVERFDGETDDPATAKVVSNGTEGSFLSLEARPVSGGFGTQVTQRVLIDPLRTLFSFDAALLSEEEIFNGNVNPNNRDALSVAVKPVDGNNDIIFLIDSLFSPVGSFASVTAGPSIFGGAIESYSVTADLSHLAGQEVDLTLSVLNFEPLITQTFFGVDNLKFSPTFAVVPLPASGLFLFFGLLSIGAMRRFKI